MFTFWHCPNYFYIRGSYPRAAGLLVNKQFFLGELHCRAVPSIRRRRRRYQHHIKVYEPRRRKRGTHQTAQSHTQNFLYINLNVFISTLYNAWIKVQRSAFVLFFMIIYPYCSEIILWVQNKLEDALTWNYNPPSTFLQSSRPQRIFGFWESKHTLLYFERCILYLRCCMWYFMVYFVIP